jgi:hypothetical protein
LAFFSFRDLYRYIFSINTSISRWKKEFADISLRYLSSTYFRLSI